MNEIFALHYKDKLITADIWIMLTGSSKYNRKTRLYMKRGIAKVQIKEIKPEYRNDVKVVRYLEERV